MKKREKQLINILLASEQYLTGADLARELDVTSRTVRNDMNQIKKTLQINGAVVYSSPGKGYLLKIDNYKKFEDFFELEKLNEIIQYTDIPDNPKDRISYITKKIIMIDYFIKIDDLAEELFVSRSTITNELKEVRENLAKYELQLTYKSGHGVKVDGDEVKKRLCIAEYYFHTSANDGYFAEDSILFASAVNQEEIRTIKKNLLKILKKNNIYMSDVSFQNLVIHLIISLRRMRYSYYIEYTQESMDNFKKYEEYKAAEEIAQELGRQFNEIWNQEEVCYICVHILAKRIILNNEPNTDPTDEAIFVTNCIAFELSRKTGISFSQDNHFMRVMSLHVAPLLLRLRSGLLSRNMLLEDIKLNYPFAYELAKIAAQVVERLIQKKLPEDECGYIALYIGHAIEKQLSSINRKNVLLVSSEGRSAMEIQKIKILNEFEEYISSLESVELYEFPNINHDKYELILSCVPITYKKSNPVIYINTILKKVDLELIKEALLRRTEKEEWKFLNYIYSYTDRDFSEFKDLINFLKYIENKNQLDSVSHFFKDKDTRKFLINDTLILFTLHENNHEFYLYLKNKTPITFNKQSFRRILFIGHKNKQLSRFQQNLQVFETLFKNQKSIEKIDKLDSEDIRYVFNEYLN